VINLITNNAKALVSVTKMIDHGLEICN